ncbi:PD-(D/E)XK nuclease family protein [Halobacillus locisalis]|uniref:PD-(D/E)XK nuclease family protein n=1 Tax=Halobacillus locisalis TaxID=220753 RepID=A0A838CXG7_9BACI|nr:PD-(D/E)XK nuclease family protein [Halobacillus locisalis]MBA2176842.1 PD-(D/E)XK nuclease family protein [Halobacillus locisalis]
MQTFSYSRLKLYETCPQRFFYKYVKGMQEEVTRPLALGKAVHKAIECLLNGFSVDESVANGIIDVNFHEEVSREDILYFLERTPFGNLRGETELHFRTPLFDYENSPEIQGFLDLWDRANNRITDFKTNYKPYHIEDNYQLALYAWAMKKVNNLEGDVKGSLLFLRQRGVSSTTFTEAKMNEAVTWARNLVNEIRFKLELLEFDSTKQNELFPYKPSIQCEHCPFAYKCFRDNPYPVKNTIIGEINYDENND